MLGLLKPTWNRRASKVRLAWDLSVYNIWPYFNRNLISASVSTPFSVCFCRFFSETFLTEQLRSLIFLISKSHLPNVLTKYFCTLHLTILCYKYEVRWHFKQQYLANDVGGNRFSWNVNSYTLNYKTSLSEESSLFRGPQNLASV